MGDGVIGSPPAFGAGKSRFESESPSNDRRPRPRRSVSEPLPSGAAPEGGIAAVVVLAAGQGTRMRSSTPKVLHALGGGRTPWPCLGPPAPRSGEGGVRG